MPKLLSLCRQPRTFRIIIFLFAISSLIFGLYVYLYSYEASVPSPIPTLDRISTNEMLPTYDDNNYNSIRKWKENNNSRSLGRNEDDVLKSKTNFVEEDISKTNSNNYQHNYWNISMFHGQCPVLPSAIPDIDSTVIFQSLGFDEDWIRTREYWNADLEKRFLDIKKSKESPYLKVFVIPHSHNDPGWLRTFEEYYFAQTKNILDNLVEKLTEFKQFTFHWSEISFLNKWWNGAHPTRKTMFKKLIAEGRLEITTGGWVMTDEATVNLYSMIDQLVEGHQWLKIHIGVKPTASWSIDPFGHGSTFPYILKNAGIKSMVIQRIHYAWKKWLAENQAGDFQWVQRWDSTKKNSIFCHNAPFDIYSIKHSCGPHPHICLNFDFRNITGEYGENYRVSIPINKSNVRQRAELLLEQYGKAASLFPHNIAMISLGDDFRFDKAIEWDQQYLNYMQLFDFINANRDFYKAEVKFGTVSDYFKAVKERQGDSNTLSFSGDFFPYSDIFSEGRPAYWSGYYATRPFWKKFYRETENSMRSAEILFTFANALTKQRDNTMDMQVFTQEYNKLVVARQWLGLFAHHDASTGTSKVNTMEDYGLKLLEATQFSQNIQMASINAILFGQSNATSIFADYELSSFGQLPRKIPLRFHRQTDGKEIVQKVTLFNSLSWTRTHYAKVVVTTPHVQVIGPNGKPIPSQLNPILDMSDYSTVYLSNEAFELTFLAELPPLSLAVYSIKRSKPKSKNVAVRSVVYCRNCSNPGKIFEINQIQQGDIQLNNERMQLLFDRQTGLLLSITKVIPASPNAPTKQRENVVVNTKCTFGGYSSIDFRSGAYLFLPDTRTIQKIPFGGIESKLFIVSGPIASELSLFHAPITMSTRIMHMGGEELEDGIFVQNLMDLGRHNAEVYMRFDTDLDSSGKARDGVDEEAQPTFYTDQNGLGMEKRVKVGRVRLEGNYYPVNTMSFIQDEERQLRFSVLVDRSHGFSSFELGRIETLIERRTVFDDSRGMGEGVTDNRPTISNYVILVEKVHIDRKQKNYANSLPTLQALRLSQALNYPPSQFLYEQLLVNSLESQEKSILNYSLLTQPIPCDTHVLNFRTMSSYNENFDIQFPTKEALLILQKFAFNCHEEDRASCGNRFFYPETTFSHLNTSYLRKTDLTGVTYTGNLSQLHSLLAEPLDIKSIVVAFK